MTFNRRNILTAALGFAATAALGHQALAQSGRGVGYRIRPARNNPPGYPNCRVYAYVGGPYNDQSISVGGNGRPPSYSPNATQCPPGLYQTGVPPASRLR